MNELFDLTFYSYPNAGYAEGFHIGLFLTQEGAETVAARYLREVPGFKDYECDYKITAYPVIGVAAEEVYRFDGWNTNEDLDEVDIITSNCFASRQEAEQALSVVRKSVSREEWVLDRCVIGRCEWQAGFARCFPGDTD